jgi:hypothetical protein
MYYSDAGLQRLLKDLEKQIIDPKKRYQLGKTTEMYYVIDTETGTIQGTGTQDHCARLLTQLLT